MTLEELQQLLQINRKDPEQVKRIQQLAGLTGKSVDGIWGKQTNNAWNEYMKANKSEIEDNIAELQAHQNAMRSGQTNPAVVDVVGYSNKLDEQQQARNAKIAQLESQIAMVEERIARNQRALTGKSYEDANNQIAALEMRKINSQDPSSIWRWQQQRQDTIKSNANDKANAIENFKNKVNMWKRTPASNTVEGIEQQISNLNSTIVEGENLGADVSELYSVLDRFERATKGDSDSNTSSYGKGTKSEQDIGQLKTVLATAKTSKELIDFKNSHSKDLTPEQLSTLDIKIKELQQKEAVKAESAKFEAWLKQRGYKNGSTGMSAKILATLRRQYKGGK